jgi:hypothetical protein
MVELRTTLSHWLQEYLKLNMVHIPVKMIIDSDFHLISDSGVFDHPVDSRWHYL